MWSNEIWPQRDLCKSGLVIFQVRNPQSCFMYPHINSFYSCMTKILTKNLSPFTDNYLRDQRAHRILIKTTSTFQKPESRKMNEHWPDGSAIISKCECVEFCCCLSEAKVNDLYIYELNLQLPDSSMACNKRGQNAVETKKLSKVD